MSNQARIDAFFSAMNAGDADGAAALVAPEVEIVRGPHALTGQAAVRELALQQDPQLEFETIALSVDSESEARTIVLARRTSRWRDGGEVAAQEDVRVAFDLDAAGVITRIEMS